MAAPTPLGDSGWLRVPTADGVYYAKPSTGETSWTVPAGLTDPLAEPPPPPPPEEAAAVDGALAALSALSAAPAAAPAPAAAAASGLPDGWIVATDPSSGGSYYVHLPTSTTSWERPSAAAAAAAAASVAAARALSLSPACAAQWARLLDFVALEATQKINAKNKKFAGLRRFAEQSARRKRENAKRRAEEEAAAAAELRALAAAAARPTRSLLAALTLEAPAVPDRDIEEYARDSFELNRKGFFGGRTTVDKVLAWKADVIRKALLKLPTTELAATAVQLFRNVLGFMGDRSSGKEDALHAEKILRTCLNAPEELRDEVFCQVVKQTTANPSAHSTRKGWLLLAILSGSLAPSRDFEPYLQAYVARHLRDAVVGDVAAYVLGRIARVAALGPRREVPHSVEIEACKALDPALVRVYHLDGSYDTMPVVSWMTPALLKEIVCQKRGIRDGTPYAIYEMTPDGMERYLESDERLLDVIAYWQRLFEEEREAPDEARRSKKAVAGLNFYRLVFKVHLYFDARADDAASQHAQYVQAVYDVVSARYPAAEGDARALAALQLQAEFGAAGLPELREHLGHYLPAKLVPRERSPAADEAAADLRRRAAAHAALAPAAAEAAYLAAVRAWPVYGSSFFLVEPQLSADLPAAVFLAVNPRGVLVIHPDTKAVLASHPYSAVPTWGHSGSSFVLHVGSMTAQTKHYFGTDQGKELNDLVRAYVNYLCESG